MISRTHGKVLGEVHARIPMVTADEQRALQMENAEADVRDECIAYLRKIRRHCFGDCCNWCGSGRACTT